MSVLDFEEATKTEKTPSAPVCPAKIIVLALARDYRGVRAKMLAETLFKSFPDKYHKPLVKFFHDVGWRETIIRLRKASKKWDYVAPVIVFVNKKLIGDDDDFNLYIRENHFLLVDPRKMVVFKKMNLLDKLQMDPMKTYIYFDVSIDYRPVGRMIFQVDGDKMPQSTKEFLELCCSQKVPLPESYHKRSRFAGSLVRRIVKQGWIRITTLDDERIYAKGKYEKGTLTCNRRGALVMNLGPRGWLASHVVIVLDQHPWMDKMYRAIGYLIDGEYVLHMMENVATTYEHPNVDVVITDNGILYSPNLMTTESFLSPELLEAAVKLKEFRSEYRKVLTSYVNSRQCLEPSFKEKVIEEPEYDVDVVVEEEEKLNEIEGEAIDEDWGEDLEEGKSQLSTISQTSKRQLEIEGSLSHSVVKSRSTSKKLLKSNSSLASKGVSSSGLRKLDDTEISEGGEYEGEGEEIVEEEVKIKQDMSEPDIQYTYVTPKSMTVMRTGYRKFEDGRRPEGFQKVGIRVPRRRVAAEMWEGRADAPLSQPVEPHTRIYKTGKFDYYEFSKKAMEQVTPKLLLAWAQGIDDDMEVNDIQRAISELLDFVDGEETKDTEGHALDAISMEDCTERFKKCLFSLPTQLLQLLKESLQEIVERKKYSENPMLTVTGDSASRVTEEFEPIQKPMKSPSDDVISGCFLSMIEFTKRMIESNTELVSNMDNLDYITSVIDEIILDKVHQFIKKKKKLDRRFKKKLPYNKFHRPGNPKKPFMTDLLKTAHGISYYVDLDLIPSASKMSVVSDEHFAEISAKRLPVVIKDWGKTSS